MRLILTQEFIVQDRSSEHGSVFRYFRFLGSDQSSLTQHGAVFLAGDLFWHLKNHFDERVSRKLLRSMEQNAGLADVLNRTFKPCAQILHPEAKRAVQFEAAGTWDPSRLFRRCATSPARGFCDRSFDPVSAAHRLPIVLISGSALEANLIVLSIRGPPRPRKFVRTSTQHENIHDLLRHGDG